MLLGRGELRVLGGLFDGGMRAQPYLRQDLSPPSLIGTGTYLHLMPMRYQPAPAML
jgi:hypothetical protein